MFLTVTPIVQGKMTGTHYNGASPAKGIKFCWLIEYENKYLNKFTKQSCWIHSLINNPE